MRFLSLLTAALLGLAVSAPAAVAIYGGSINSRTLAGNVSKRESEKVYMALDLATGDTVSLVLGKNGQQRTFRRESPLTFAITKAADQKGATFTVLVRAQQSADVTDSVSLKATVLRGKDSPVNVGQGSTALPKLLTGTAAAVDQPAGQALGTFVEAVTSLRLNPLLTGNVNAQNLTLEHAVQMLERMLNERNYANERDIASAGATKVSGGALVLSGDATGNLIAPGANGNLGTPGNLNTAGSASGDLQTNDGPLSTGDSVQPQGDPAVSQP